MESLFCEEELVQPSQTADGVLVTTFPPLTVALAAISISIVFGNDEAHNFPLSWGYLAYYFCIMASFLGSFRRKTTPSPC